MRDALDRQPAMPLDQAGTEEAVDTMLTVCVLLCLLVLLVIVAAFAVVYRSVQV